MSRKELQYAQLLNPIPGPAPTGESLRYDPVYDQIGHARTQEPTLSQGVWKREMQQADWPLVEELCENALATRSKDLQLVVWLTEAWLHRYQLPGLAAGCNLLAELHTLYPAELIPAPETPIAGTLPLPDDPAIEHRLNMIQWMNERFAIDLKMLSLTAPLAGSDVAPVSLADLESSLYAQQAARRSGSSEKAAYDADLVRGLQLTAADYLTQLWTELAEALGAVDRLEKTLDRVYGSANGGLLRIHQVLQQMRQAIEPTVVTIPRKESVEQAATPAPSSSEAFRMESILVEDDQEPSLDVQTLIAETVTLPSIGMIETREQAYDMLATIATFLARLEPHSPVPYLLRRAIAWGGMSLMELLPELLQDQAALKDVGHLLRISADGSSTTMK